MLFKTVFGIELEAIYLCVQQHKLLNKDDVIRAFIPHSFNPNMNISSQNIEDALSFLVSSCLLDLKDQKYSAKDITMPFKIAMIHHLRSISLGLLRPHHPLDPGFMSLLDMVFIKPNNLFVNNLHAQANALSDAKAEGGISKEKINAWKRVMEYLELGYRAHNGFICIVSPKIMQYILSIVIDKSLSIQDFIENYLSQFLPHLTRSGDLANAIQKPLLHLAECGVIKLTQLQDSPTKTYFQPQNLRFIEKMG